MLCGRILLCLKCDQSCVSCVVHAQLLPWVVVLDMVEAVINSLREAIFAPAPLPRMRVPRWGLHGTTCDGCLKSGNMCRIKQIHTQTDGILARFPIIFKAGAFSRVAQPYPEFTLLSHRRLASLVCMQVCEP
jgi:hypothetical protein